MHSSYQGMRNCLFANISSKSTSSAPWEICYDDPIPVNNVYQYIEKEEKEKDC